MTEFTPFQSLIGGVIIGFSAVLLMAFNGRIAGMTGILTGIIPPLARDWAWRAAFVAGAVIVPLIVLLAGGEIAFSVPVPTAALAVGGFLVGICGIARLSPRSIAAVATFMLTAFATVFVIRHVIGA